MGLNRAELIGRLGKEPETREVAGQTVCTMSIATDETWTDKNGERQKKTEWHRVVAWRKTAEHCSKYLSKGRLVYVDGRIRTREWEDKDGVKRWMTEIEARDVQFLDKPKDQQRGSSEASPSGDLPLPEPGPPVDDAPWA